MKNPKIGDRVKIGPDKGTIVGMSADTSFVKTDEGSYIQFPVHSVKRLVKKKKRREYWIYIPKSGDYLQTYYTKRMSFGPGSEEIHVREVKP